MKDDRLYLHHRLERCDRITASLGPAETCSGRRKNCRMRDGLIHDYFGVDLDEVWNVALLEQFLATEGPGSTPAP